MSCGIYCIENLVNGKKYIGQGLNVKKRMAEYHNQSHALNRAIKKYGKEGFKRYVLVYCEEGELERLEKICIKIFRSHVSKHGYNISWGGKSFMTGRKHSKKSIKLMSKLNAGKNNPRYNQPVSEETRKLMGKVRSGNKNGMYGMSGEKSPVYGTTHSDEWKKNMSEKLSGKNNPMFARKSSNASSPYFGVTLAAKKYWVAYLKQHGKTVRIGTFKTELDAARAYDKYIFENNLPNPLNFPEEYAQNNALDKN